MTDVSNSSANREAAATIRWSGIQQILEDACSDTLILMDAAYATPAMDVTNSILQALQARKSTPAAAAPAAPAANKPPASIAKP